MATERSTYQSHLQYPDQKAYDLNYYGKIADICKGVVLDLGCGAGLLTSLIAEKPEVERVYAVDKFPSIDRVCKGPKIIQSEQNLAEGFLPPFEEKFDTIVCTEFIEHISKEDLKRLLAKLQAVLGKDGVFTGTTPIKVAPTTNPYHVYEYTFGEFIPLFEEAGFVTDVKDIGHGCQLWTAKKSA